MITRVRMSVLPPLLSFFILSKAYESAPAASPSASTELICHTAHASECYPAIFHPTEHFQRIHDDQSVPVGLHIRMNLATGIKEARLNVPEPPGTPQADLLIIDDLPPPPNTEEHDTVVDVPGLQDQSDSSAAYERIEPYHPAAFNAADSSLFYSSIASFESTTALSDTDLPALHTLLDLAYSIHWGFALARDSTVCQFLVSAIAPGSAASAELRSAAILLLSTAIHNNPDALNALLSHLYPSQAGATPVVTVLAALRDPEQGGVMLNTRTVVLLSQLCQDTEQLRIFVHSGGLTTLFDLFAPEKMTPDDGKDKFRGRVANFIYDRVLLNLNSAGGLAPQSGLETTVLESDQALSKDLKPWCNAFTNALRMHKVAGVSEADAIYNSLKETSQALKEAHGRFGICGNESKS